nr:hypothetical protein [Martelella lutilitoris]
MAEMIGVDMHHDRIEPSAKIVAMPLRAMGEGAFDRILQQVGAVFWRTGEALRHAAELRQAAPQLRFEQAFGRGGIASPRWFAVRPGARPARDC